MTKDIDMSLQKGLRISARGHEFVVHSVTDRYVCYTVQQGGEPVEDMRPVCTSVAEFTEMLRDLDAEVL
jgi:hypothetical protein